MNALVLVAHADDETLGAGGTIRKLVMRGWKVEVVILSDGIVRARGAEQDNRPDAVAACQRLAFLNHAFWAFQIRNSMRFRWRILRRVGELNSSPIYYYARGY